MELGDMVEAALTKVGITKDRVERFLGRPCRCIERQEKLNMLDRWARMTVKKNLRGAKAYFERLTKAYEDCPEQSNLREQNNERPEGLLQPSENIPPP